MMRITAIIAIISALFGAGSGFYAAWHIQSGNIAKIELEAANERLAKDRAAHAVKERQTDAVITAQNAATIRARGTNRAADAAASSGHGLRVATADTVRAATADPDACPIATATLATVFGECVAEYSTLAANADRHASDVQTISESWPK